MKKTKHFMLIGLAIMLILSSCTMQKRVYMPGYHVEWFKSKHNQVKQDLASNDNGKQKEQSQTVTVPNSLNDDKTIDNGSTVSDENLTASVDNSVILPTEKPVVFSKSTNSVTAKTSTNSETKTIIAKKVSKAKKKADKKDTSGGGKSQVVALILCILVGVLGIHRFYLGYTGIGILMLLTGGVCGILALIDLIRIITGDLKPRGGDYSEKF